MEVRNTQEVGKPPINTIKGKKPFTFLYHLYSLKFKILSLLSFITYLLCSLNLKYSQNIPHISRLLSSVYIYSKQLKFPEWSFHICHIHIHFLLLPQLFLLLQLSLHLLTEFQFGVKHSQIQIWAPGGLKPLLTTHILVVVIAENLHFVLLH